jgi:cytochrome c556
LGQAAANKDAQAVIAAFQTLQTACHACHRDFRKPFVEHFYGKH